jgi:hypothetical protein
MYLSSEREENDASKKRWCVVELNCFVAANCRLSEDPARAVRALMTVTERAVQDGSARQPSGHARIYSESPVVARGLYDRERVVRSSAARVGRQAWPCGPAVGRLVRSLAVK